MSWDEVAHHRLYNRSSRTASVTSSFDGDLSYDHSHDDGTWDDDDMHIHFEDDVLRSVDQLLEGGDNEDDSMIIDYEYPLKQYVNSSSTNRKRNSTRQVMCKFFLNGTCKAGDRCRFSHGATQTDPIPISRSRRKSSTSSTSSNHSTDSRLKYCKFYEQGHCKNTACHFAHDPSRTTLQQDYKDSSGSTCDSLSPPPYELEEEETESDNAKVCPFYLKGECRYGDRCRNLHIRQTANKKKYDQITLERMAKTPCKYNRQGVCPFGALCYFSHEPTDEQDIESYSSVVSNDKSH